MAYFICLSIERQMLKFRSDTNRTDPQRYDIPVLSRTHSMLFMCITQTQCTHLYCSSYSSHFKRKELISSTRWENRWMVCCVFYNRPTVWPTLRSVRSDLIGHVTSGAFWLHGNLVIDPLLFPVAGPVHYPKPVQTVDSPCLQRQASSRECVKTSTNQCLHNNSCQRHLAKRSQRRKGNHRTRLMKCKTGGYFDIDVWYLVAQSFI